MRKLRIGPSLILPLILMTSCLHGHNSGRVIKLQKLPENYKVCVIGDTGKDSKIQKIVAQALSSEGCHQVRHLGDIIYPSGIENSADPKLKTHFYQYYKSMIESEIPFYMSLGNHDYKKNPSTWIKLAVEIPQVKFPSLYFMHIYQDICFITLDTNAGFIKQLLWLKQLKNEYAKTCKLKLVFGHHPLYSSGKHGNANLGVRLFLKNTIHGYVDAYFAGHDHNLEDLGKVKGTSYFVSGSGGAVRALSSKPPVWGVSKPGYLTFTITHQDNTPTINYSFVSIDETTHQKSLERSGHL